MSGVENADMLDTFFSAKPGQLANRRRARSIILAAAMCAGLPAAKAALGGTFVTSPFAPTSPDISQPDFSQTTFTNYLDYSDNYGGPGQVFTPTTNLTLNSFTFKGGGGAGGALGGNWTVSIGSLNYNGWSATATPLDTESVSGAPIATDVAAGKKSQYDTFELSTPITLTAGTIYYWAVSTAGAGYYGLAGGTAAPQSGGNAFDLSSNQTQETFPQGFDRTFFINGTPTLTVQQSSHWITNGNGNWETGANWSPGEPQFDGDVATFDNNGGAITANPIVTLSNAVQVASLNFNTAAVNYTINNGGAGQIRVGNASTGAVINVTAGNHFINAPVYIPDVTQQNPIGTITISSGASLTIASLSGGSYGNMTISGGGSLTVDKLDTMNVTINGATVTTLAGSAETRGGYDAFNNGAVLNINSKFEVKQLYDDSSDTINIGPNGSFVTENNYGSQVDVGGKFTGSGLISIGTGDDNTASGGGMQINGNNSGFSGPILVTNGFQLRVGSPYAAANDNSLGDGSATNVITLDNAVLQPVNGISGNHKFVINSGGGTIMTTDVGDTAHGGGYTAANGPNGPFTVGIGSVSGSGTLTVDGGGNLTVAAQVVAANASGGVRSLALGGLNLINNSNLSLGSPTLHTNRSVLTVGSLSLSGTTSNWTSTLDLGSNDLIVQNGNLQTVLNQVKQGYSNGSWQGSGGILSSAAAADPSHLTTLGTILNHGANGSSIYTTFDGVSVSTSDVLVKYTYYGDANLDGVVDGSDYTLIDNGYNAGLTGWLNGDFNGDGKVDATDYSLIDAAYLSHNASLAAELANPLAQSTAEIAGVSTSAVPEPASLTLLGFGAVGLLSRRKSRQRL
jgi:hypothetical protein